MSASRRPKVLLFDLDDTIVTFSTGQRDLWLRTLSQYRTLLNRPTGEGVRPASDEDLVAFARVLDEVVTPAYWGEPARAAAGRLDLFSSRREVLYWAACCYFEAADVSTLDEQWRAGKRVVHSARFGEHWFAIADAYTRAKEEAVAPFDGAADVLRAVREAGFKLALVTNGGAEFQRRKLRRYGLESFFDSIVIEGEWGVGKPHRSVFQRALEVTGTEARQAWMIGDNYEADIVGAARVGIAGVWMRQGRDAPSGDVAPLHSIDDLSELLALLQALPSAG